MIIQLDFKIIQHSIDRTSNKQIFQWQLNKYVNRFINKLMLSIEMRDPIFFIQYQQYDMIFQTIIICTFIILNITAITPQIFLIETQIYTLENRNKILAKYRNHIQYSQNNTQYINQPSLPQFQSNNILFHQKCKLQASKLQFFMFQTVQQIYFAVNYPQIGSFSLYNMKCEIISEIMNVQIFKVICDRGICQSGVFHFIGKDEILYKGHEINNFSKIQYIKNVTRLSKIIDGNIRYRRKDKVQIFIYYQNGEIIVIDQKGNQTILFNLEGQNEIIHVSDHHPYPFVITKMNWISIIDTMKYHEINHNCPYIGDIKYIVSQSYYGDILYIITNRYIINLQIDIGKKTCLIKQVFNIQLQLNEVSKATYFNNLLFIDNKVYNFTEIKIYSRSQCNNQNNIQFIQKKNNQQQIYSIQNCCNNQQCTLKLCEIKKWNKDKNILIWLTIIFIFIIFVSISFMKKTNINNLDFDDPQRMKQIQIQQQIQQLSKQSNKNKK